MRPSNILTRPYMFACQRCTRQAIRAVAQVHDLLHLSGSRRPLSTLDTSSRSLLRDLQDSRSLCNSAGGKRPLSTDSIPPLAPEDQDGAAFAKIRRAPAVTRSGARPHQRRQDATPRDDHSTSPLTFESSSIRERKATTRRAKSPTPRALNAELRYLKDPLELANHVEYTLKQHDHEKALALVRMSSRAVANIVSWNHVIKYQLANDKYSRALETYNDLKKRGLQPDSHTYLILLDGLAKNAHHPKALGRALSIYHSLNGPKSNAAPSIMHTNAVLKVCSRARDSDSMWDIFSNLPKRGPHAADAITYTTVLNSLLVDASNLSTSQEKSAEQVAALDKILAQARSLWSDVVVRWRDDALKMHEALVCAMGRLLLNGNRPQDWDDAFSLLQQTIGITRLTPPLLGPDQMPSETPFTIAVVTDNKQVARHRRPQFAAPGNNTLSLAIGICTKANLKDAALKYWRLLTDRTKYATKPDADNFHVLLRLLRLACSSSDALTLVTADMTKVGAVAQPKTFRIALSACQRAQLASAADARPWQDALELIKHMSVALSEPDPAALATFLKMARHRANRERSSVDKPHHEAGSTAEAAKSGITAQQEARNRAAAVYVESLALVDRYIPAMRSVVAIGTRHKGLDRLEYGRSCLEQLLPALDAAHERLLALKPSNLDETSLSRRKAEVDRLRASLEAKAGPVSS